MRRLTLPVDTHTHTAVLLCHCQQNHMQDGLIHSPYTAGAHQSLAPRTADAHSSHPATVLLWRAQVVIYAGLAIMLRGRLNALLMLTWVVS